MTMMRIATIMIVAFSLTGCGMGGMARSMQPVVEGFDEGERVSREIRGDRPDDPDG